MTGSQNSKFDILLALYQDSRSVFRLKDVAMLSGESDFQVLNKKLNYLVRQGKLLNPRKGVYAKKDYLREELACNIFVPSYISLEYVLQKAGVVFQYDTAITSVSYLSRSIVVGDDSYNYRKIKSPVLLNTRGIQRLSNHVNMATPERAFLDLLYLNPLYYFDNINPINKDTILSLLPLYDSKALNARVIKTLQYAGY